MDAKDLREDIALTVNNVVYLGRGAFMHPYSFRDMFGEECYQELLKRPRVICEYDFDFEEE